MKRKSISSETLGCMKLREFHNVVKRDLIRAVARGKMLDVACGRGGDIAKWMQTPNITSVTGFDMSLPAIREALQRLATYITRFPETRTRITFLHLADFGHKPIVLSSFDCVSCMFAMHHFFLDTNTADRFIANVSANLKPGGVFFGCVPDGARIKAQDTDLVRIEILSDSEYTFAMKDTIVEDPSHEGFVHANVLAQICARHGLVPRPLPLSQLAPSSTCLHPFAPTDLPTALANVSKLFSAFCFEKNLSTGKCHENSK